MQIDDNTIYNTILGALGAVLTALGAAWQRLTQRVGGLERDHVSREEIDKLKDASVQKDDFKDYIERTDKSREELRDSVIKLFDRVDEVKDLLIELRKER